MLTRDQKFSLEMAQFYRSRGLNPIPSSMDEKKPLYRFADDFGWDRMFPSAWFTEESWQERPTTNLQCVTGLAFRLVVFDLDGLEAKQRWDAMGRTPKTWVTHRERGNSWHVWFRTPKDYGESMPSCFVWKGEGKHVGIERLADRKLIVAPPSYHAVHKDSRYRFIDDYNSPKRLSLPAEAPSWVLRLKPVEAAPTAKGPLQSGTTAGPRRASSSASRIDSGPLPDREEILAGIHDKIALAASWGVRFAGRPNGRGWYPCHAVGREDRNPSAAVHVESGTYVDLGSNTKLSLFDLAVECGVVRDFKEAAKLLSER